MSRKVKVSYWRDGMESSLDSYSSQNSPLADSEALLRYVKERQPRYVYHGHVHSAIGTMIGKAAVVSVFESKIVTLD